MKKTASPNLAGLVAKTSQTSGKAKTNKAASVRENRTTPSHSNPIFSIRADDEFRADLEAIRADVFRREGRIVSMASFVRQFVSNEAAKIRAREKA